MYTNSFNKRYNNKTVLYGDRIAIPKREDFLNEDEIRRDTQRLTHSLPVIYTANYVKEHSAYGNNKTQILTVGILQSGMKVSVLIRDIDIYFDVFPMRFINAPIGSPMKNALEYIENNEMGISDSYRYLQELFPDEMSKFMTSVEKLTKETSAYKHILIHNRIFNIGVEGKILGVRLFYNNTGYYKNATYIAATNTGAYTHEELFVATYSSGNLIEVIAARYDVYFGAWMMLTNYSITNSNKRLTKTNFNIEISINDFCRIEDRHYENLGITADNLNIYKSIFFAIDIETTDTSHAENIKSENNNKGILSATNAVFNIGCVISLESDDKDVNYRINIINTRAPKEVIQKYYSRLGVPNSYTIVATNVSETLKAFIKVMAAIHPDFVPGYNSLDFDIPQLLTALRVNNLYDEFYTATTILNNENTFIYKNIYKHNGVDYHYNKGGYTFWSNMKTTCMVSGISNNIVPSKNTNEKLKVNNGKLPCMKVSGQNKEYHEINIPGILMLDVMLISWKKFPNDNNKGGMNYYLKKCGLKPKLDVPYYKIWLFYNMSQDYDIIAIPETRVGKCEHGYSQPHEIVAEDNSVHTCEGYIHYYLGDKQISYDIYNALDSTSLIDSIQKIVEYCSYDAEGALTLIKYYSYMMEKRKFCKLVNLPFDKVVFRADGKKVENGLRKTLYKNGFSYLEETIVLGESSRPVFNIRRILNANQNINRYHVKTKAPKNKGALVKLHKKGKISATFIIDENKHEEEVPVFAFDFASLYPSILMAYNACNTTITFDINVINKLLTVIPDLKFTIIDADDLMTESEFPDEMDAYYTNYYNIKSFKGSKVYVISHNNNPDGYGIYAKFLSEYFGIRNATKEKMGIAGNRAKEILTNAMESEHYQQAFNTDNKGCNNLKSYLEKVLFTDNEEYRNSLIEYSNQFGEQLAVKIVMNTMYGTLDYVASPMYSPLVACIVTYFGRRYLEASNELCLKEGKVLIYNDTDSTYAHHNPDDFRDIVVRHVRGEFNRHKLGKKLVMRSIKLSLDSKSLKEHYSDKIDAIKKLIISNGDTIELVAKLEKTKYRLANVPETTFADRLNNRFAEMSGGRFLRQVYEETLYPAVYCMSKKYFGLIHESKYTDIENFTMRDILFRGLKIRTANCTQYEKRFSERLFSRILKESNISIRDIVFEELNTKLAEKADYSNIVLYENTARYKSGVKNKILSMIQRIEKTSKVTTDPKLKSLYRVPFELENVYYIITKNNKPYSIVGRKNTPRKHELFEYTSVVEYLYKKHLETGCAYKEIDTLQYVLSVVATCAQTLSYVEDDNFGYYEGIINKTYVKLIAKNITNYCINYYSATEESTKIANDMIIYKSYVRKNKDIFNLIIDMIFDNQQCDSDTLTLAKSMVRKMINLSNKMEFRKKLHNIANVSFIDFGIIYEDFFNDTVYKLLNNTNIDENYISILRDDYNQIHNAMEEVYPYLDDMREIIVDYMFSIIEPLAHDAERIIQLDKSKVKQICDETDKLAFCEALFRMYCGISTLAIGTTKYYYMNKKIEFQEL